VSLPPDLLPFDGDWANYEEMVYRVFVDSFVRAGVKFCGLPVNAQRRPETRGKGFSFWHTISEAPERANRNEEDRVPSIRRCERIRWIEWVIRNADAAGFSWWENRRSGQTHVVIWAREYDFAVVLAKRNGYYVLKTAYSELAPHRRKTFEAELGEFMKSPKS
jgi:hypothetical protein